MAAHQDDRDLREDFSNDAPAQSIRVNENPQEQLDFDRGDERGGRAGDTVSAERDRQRFPAERVREAGFTGGETPAADVTDDDLAPQTLLDEPRESSADLGLRVTGETGLGLGGGQDEAELADRQPIGEAQARAREKLIREHASDPNRVEFAEAQEIADREASAADKRR